MEILTGKYSRLYLDLRRALRLGREAEKENQKDGGTSNFDAVAVCLPRWQHAKIKQAAKQAGTDCFKWNLYGKSFWVFEPETTGQGDRRVRNVQAMAASLSLRGYDVKIYRQMD